MNGDIIWQAIRYMLITGSASLVTHGYMTGDQQTAIVSGVIAVLTAAWGFYVKWRTRTVPAATGARADVPTVSPSTGTVIHAHWLAISIAALLALPLLACTRNPDGSINWTLTTQNYVAGANATKGVLAEIGTDLVTIDCMSASLIQVVAKDAGAATRVQNALDRNAQIARDACPLLTGRPAVQVVAGG